MDVHLSVNMPISSNICLYKVFQNVPSSYLKCTLHCCCALSVQDNSSLEFRVLCFSSCDKYIIHRSFPGYCPQIPVASLLLLDSFIPHVRDCHTCLCSLISILCQNGWDFIPLLCIYHITFLHSSMDTHLDFSVS